MPGVKNAGFKCLKEGKSVWLEQKIENAASNFATATFADSLGLFAIVLPY